MRALSDRQRQQHPNDQHIPLGRKENRKGLIQWPDQIGAGDEQWMLIPDGHSFRITSTNGQAIVVKDRGRVEMRTPQRLAQ